MDKGFNGQTWFRVKERYLKEEAMTDREETYAAIRKLLASLDDPFTRFLEPEKYAALRRGASGTVTGVGVEVAFSQNADTLGKLLVRQALHCCSFHAIDSDRRSVEANVLDLIIVVPC